MEYKVVRGCSVDDIGSIVNGWMVEGWTPLGGVSVFVNGRYEVHYAQAMTRDK